MGIRPPTQHDLDEAVLAARHVVTEAHNLDDPKLLRLGHRCVQRAEYLRRQLVQQVGEWDDRFNVFDDPEERDG
jgi:hypothetical protein